MIGFCVGLMTRHTAAALGVLLDYLFIWVARTGVLSQLEWAQRLTPGAAEANLAAIVENGHTYEIPVRRLTEDGVTIEYVERTVSLTHGVVCWAGSARGHHPRRPPGLPSPGRDVRHLPDPQVI